ncbi:MAG: hypothetical protein ACE3K2_19825 [Paenibacillus sp.]|uniref:hypothetical protein n=1 Tax=Paenibacillus sp. TaxID=58172 RepID=UPI003B769CAD
MNSRLINLMIGFFVLILLVGCTANEEETENISNSENIIYSQEYTKELNDIEKNMLDNPGIFQETKNKNYKISASVNLSIQDGVERMVYEVFIKDPKIKLEDLKMSFNLNPKMLQKLNTSNIFESNVLNDKPLTISTDSETTGASLFRAFLLDKSKLDKGTLNLYKDMFVKISYIIDGKVYQDFFKLQATPSEEIQTYLKEASSEE